VNAKRGERLEKTLARVAREQGRDQERHDGGFPSWHSAGYWSTRSREESSTVITSRAGLRCSCASRVRLAPRRILILD
jgi:hypothetical protein